jgi:hypothetical protein
MEEKMYCNSNQCSIRNTVFFILFCAVLSISGNTVQQDLNEYFAKMDETFTKLQKSSAIKSTNLKMAENLFFRELKKNQSYFAYLRANSKGKIVSEVVRGKTVERTGTDVQNESWFKNVQKNNEDFYTVFKDEERGRYYLIWSKPILKQERFVGAACLKIDLWDSFYEFSNSIYYPFLIKLGKKSLFSHKWSDDISYQEEPLTIPGIKNISVRYIPEKKVESQDSIVKPVPSVVDSAISKSDQAAPVKKVSSKPEHKKPLSGAIIFLIVVLIAAILVTLFLIISKRRNDAILKKIEEDDF